MKSLKIGNIQLKNPIILAPMMEITDLPYRLLCRKYGASLAFTEMINAGAILHTNPKTKKMMFTTQEDRPLGIQITGRNTEDFKKVLKKIPKSKYNLIDLNCGCPSSRIIDNDSGSFLLKNPKKIEQIIKILKNDDRIVTVKIRLGFKKNNCLSIAKKIEKSGADALTIHARLANQGASVPADWSQIKKVKKQIGIPVIGNGDIFTPEDAEKMLDIADGAMIGRAAIGNPKIFKQITSYLQTGKKIEITPKEKIKDFQEYLQLSKKYQTQNLVKIKWIGSKFLRGFNGAIKVRKELMHSKTIEDLEKQILKFKQSLNY